MDYGGSFRIFGVDDFHRPSAGIIHGRISVFSSVCFGNRTASKSAEFEAGIVGGFFSGGIGGARRAARVVDCACFGSAGGGAVAFGGDGIDGL